MITPYTGPFVSGKVTRSVTFPGKKLASKSNSWTREKLMTGKRPRLSALDLKWEKFPLSWTISKFYPKKSNVNRALQDAKIANILLVCYL